MKKKLLYCSVALMWLNGCGTVNEDETEYIEGASSVISQSVIQNSRLSVSFSVTASWGSSCGSFSRSAVSVVDSVVSIKVYGRQPKDAVCLTVMSSFECTIMVSNLHANKNYVFKFWQSEAMTLDTAFVVKY